MIKFNSPDSDEHKLFDLFQTSIDIHRASQDFEKASGLTLAQWCLLRRLVEMPGCSAQELAGAVGVHPSTLTPSLKRLEDRGEIFVGEDPRDSRKKIIALTRKGYFSLSKARSEINTVKRSLDHP